LTAAVSWPSDKQRHKVHFDNLTPLYPTKWLKLEIEDPTIKDLSPRVIDRSSRAPSGF
jgi:transcription termination factor Rho